VIIVSFVIIVIGVIGSMIWGLVVTALGGPRLLNEYRPRHNRTIGAGRNLYN
jgi:hypothetical protein